MTPLTFWSQRKLLKKRTLFIWGSRKSRSSSKPLMREAGGKKWNWAKKPIFLWSLNESTLHSKDLKYITVLDIYCVNSVNSPSQCRDRGRKRVCVTNLSVEDLPELPDHLTSGTLVQKWLLVRECWDSGPVSETETNVWGVPFKSRSASQDSTEQQDENDLWPCFLFLTSLFLRWHLFP